MKSLRFLSLYALAFTDNVMAIEKKSLTTMIADDFIQADKSIDNAKTIITQEPTVHRVEHFNALKDTVERTRKTIDQLSKNAQDKVNMQQATEIASIDNLITKENNDLQRKLEESKRDSSTVERISNTYSFTPQFNEMTKEEFLYRNQFFKSNTDKAIAALLDEKESLKNLHLQDTTELTSINIKFTQKLAALVGQYKTRWTEILSKDQIPWIIKTCNNDSNHIERDLIEYKRLEVFTTKDGKEFTVRGDINSQGKLKSPEAKNSDMLLILTWAIEQAQDKQNIPFGLYTCKQTNSTEPRDYFGPFRKINVSYLTRNWIKYQQSTTCITCDKNEATYQAFLSEYYEREATAQKVEKEKAAEKAAETNLTETLTSKLDVQEENHQQ